MSIGLDFYPMTRLPFSELVTSRPTVVDAPALAPTNTVITDYRSRVGVVLFVGYVRQRASEEGGRVDSGRVGRRYAPLAEGPRMNDAVWYISYRWFPLIVFDFR